MCVCVRRSPLAQMEEERREHVNKMKKMEMEMEQVFEMKVKEKVQKLRDSEAEVSYTNTAGSYSGETIWLAGVTDTVQNVTNICSRLNLQ